MGVEVVVDGLSKSLGKQTLWRDVTLTLPPGEISVTFRPGHGGADIQPGQLLRITGKPKQTGNRPMSLVDPTYQVIEDPAKAGRPGDSGESGEQKGHA